MVQTFSPADRARFVRDRMPPQGLFAGQEFRISPHPFLLEVSLAKELDSLGRVLLQFNRAVNLLYRQSVAGKQPAWVAAWLDQGKPPELIDLQRSSAFKSDLPRVIRPDILLTDSGIRITELDAVPGGIGLTAWLNQTYAELGARSAEASETRPTGLAASTAAQSVPPSPIRTPHAALLGGAEGMLRGFESIFGDAPKVRIVISAESATYQPEMAWLATQFEEGQFEICDSRFAGFTEGDAVYRFFELFDLANVENAKTIFRLAQDKKVRLTPPPKTIFEEKMLFALLWNRNLRGFWRQELGEGFLERLLRLVPYTWLVDPMPLPPHGAIPELNLTDWHQLKALSQRDRELILKVSGFSEQAWGARGVYLGSDLSASDWTEAVDLALRSFGQSPFVLQRYHKPKTVETPWFDFAKEELVKMSGRVRLCPYYFVLGDGDSARANLGGVLATICPADKKIIHGMKDAVLVPCTV
ncbi:MAG: hypothetical protein HYY23_13735 [Verrucomicrobia bacterium]|nr:hypothetical protein [Verrucomicrobiota bacterium]